MNYLHSLSPKIIHRDLKSLNLLLDSNGMIKVADFGLARVRIDSGNMTTKVGTPLYMAPELIRGEQYTESVDVYSFGIILWEMFTNITPFKGMDPLNVCLGVAYQGLRPVIPSNCPLPLSHLITSCWNSAAELRPSFDSILVMLSRI
eukprot:TRINITY_DN2285_c0_g1_i3.p1 TRINITY_DN2285_c0_g1~~TRINITY_DN2285_c0_g1_i3.p1  ORF type:complete len:147 (+),score=28.89 TRINITY_DN2285_c0_g1_i3:125-565(+)